MVLMGTVGAGPQLGPTGRQLAPTQFGSTWQGPTVGKVGKATGRAVVTGRTVTATSGDGSENGGLGTG